MVSSLPLKIPHEMVEPPDTGNRSMQHQHDAPGRGENGEEQSKTIDMKVRMIPRARRCCCSKLWRRESFVCALHCGVDWVGRTCACVLVPCTCTPGGEDLWRCCHRCTAVWYLLMLKRVTRSTVKAPRGLAPRLTACLSSIRAFYSCNEMGSLSKSQYHEPKS